MLQRTRIEVDAHVTQRRSLALQDSPASKVGIDVVSSGGISETIACHKPEVAFDPKYALVAAESPS